MEFLIQLHYIYIYMCIHHALHALPNMFLINSKYIPSVEQSKTDCSNCTLKL